MDPMTAAAIEARAHAEEEYRQAFRETHAPVPAGAECPTCGEDDMFALTWQDDDQTVHCTSCGSYYAPPPLF